MPPRPVEPPGPSAVGGTTRKAAGSKAASSKAAAKPAAKKAPATTKSGRLRDSAVRIIRAADS